MGAKKPPSNLLPATQLGGKCGGRNLGLYHWPQRDGAVAKSRPLREVPPLPVERRGNFPIVGLGGSRIFVVET
jgi:hypothetical protein